MRYTTEIEISLPLKRVLELFDDPKNLPKWQPELISFDHVSGKAGHPGAKSVLKYQMGKREVTMIETVTKRDLPEEFAGTYEAKGVFNTISNRFIPLEKDKTKWISENEFKFTGLMALMAFFMKGAFKKQTMKYMTLFKSFAENSNQPK